jgi:murein DD-endopeptidase MepM/ murein hydrolase activator NlpD
MIHQLDDFKFVESFYAHCDTILVHENQWVKRGEQIGTIGNCKGRYYAHLHFEMRDSINMEIGGGYSENTNGYLNPTAFIKNNRPDGK